MYLFRLVEYVSFYHVDDQLKGSIKRALAVPNSPSKAQELATRLIGLVRDSKADDYARFRSTILDLVEKKHVENLVLANNDKFSTEIKFDGGFVLKPLIPDKALELGAHGMDNFVSTLRDIRNALSHGRDQKTGQVILPTLKNFRKLQPWVDLLETAAAEVILYEGIF